MSDGEGTSGAVEIYGHTVPPFESVFPRVFRAGVEVMAGEQIDAVAAGLSEADRKVLGGFLGAEGIERVVEGLPGDKAERLAKHYVADADVDLESFRGVYPRLAVVTNNTLSLAQLRDVLGTLSAEDLASQSLFFGDEGRAAAFSALKPDRIEAILDRSEDWVLLATGKRSVQALSHYTATLQKQERIGRKLQGTETIDLKVRHEPRAFHMKWRAGPHKGRELIYNEPLLGAGRIRVREGGLLGVVPVTISIDSAIARRGTKHLVTEVGLLPLIELIERDYLKAAPAGDLERRNHGIAELDGQPVYRMESVLPRDRARGYYCHRLMQYLDYVRGFEVKAEVYNFDDELDEEFHYQRVDPAARLTDADFEPKNRAYKL